MKAANHSARFLRAEAVQDLILIGQHDGHSAKRIRVEKRNGPAARWRLRLIRRHAVQRNGKFDIWAPAASCVAMKSPSNADLKFVARHHPAPDLRPPPPATLPRALPIAVQLCGCQPRATTISP